VADISATPAGTCQGVVPERIEDLTAPRAPFCFSVMRNRSLLAQDRPEKVRLHSPPIIGGWRRQPGPGPRLPDQGHVLRVSPFRPRPCFDAVAQPGLASMRLDRYFWPPFAPSGTRRPQSPPSDHSPPFPGRTLWCRRFSEPRNTGPECARWRPGRLPGHACPDPAGQAPLL
jgi:hypothetical protein